MSVRDNYVHPPKSMRLELPEHQATPIFDWGYGSERSRLLSLYEKGKTKQWNASERIDWSLDIDNDQSTLPDEFVPISSSPIWAKLSRTQRDEVRKHLAVWLNSQFLHGEQGALMCTAKLVEVVPSLDAKFFAATQVVDEARHVEVYARFLDEKLGLKYPVNPHLEALLAETLTDARWDMTYLGMQVMVEGVALAAFSIMRDWLSDPLSRQINAYVMQDEARHIAFGRIALQDVYENMDSTDLAVREDFVIEASRLMRDRFLMEEVWEHFGFDVAECIRHVEEAQLLSAFRKALFSRVVPTIKDIGLLTPKVRAAFVDLGVIEFESLDLDGLAANDEAVADEVDRLQAVLRHESPMEGLSPRTSGIAQVIRSTEETNP